MKEGEMMPKILDEWLGYCHRTEVVPRSAKSKEHNKWWATCLLQDDDGSYRVHTLYAGLGKKSSERIERFNKRGGRSRGLRHVECSMIWSRRNKVPAKAMWRGSLAFPSALPRVSAFHRSHSVSLLRPPGCRRLAARWHLRAPRHRFTCRQRACRFPVRPAAPS